MTFFEGQLAFIGKITYRPTLAYPVVVRTLTHQVLLPVRLNVYKTGQNGLD